MTFSNKVITVFVLVILICIGAFSLLASDRTRPEGRKLKAI
jgi:hypothetical protein